MSEIPKILTKRDLDSITNPGEKFVAGIAVTKPNLQVAYQVPVDGRVADFEFTNIATGKSTIIEVTAKRGSFDRRKKNQIRDLEECGKRFRLLNRKNLEHMGYED